MLYLSGIDRGIDGGTASIIATFEPIVAIIFGIVIFNESIEFLQILGIIIVLFGIALPVLNNKANKKIKIGSKYVKKYSEKNEEE
jgi:drug/metabolite transporter (DMT)-like permease